MPSPWDYEGKPWYEHGAVWGMIGLGTAETVFLFMQYAEMEERKSSAGVSREGFMVYLISVLGWMIWGTISHDVALLITNTIALVGATLVLYAIYYYSDEDYDPEPVSLKNGNVAVV